MTRDWCALCGTRIPALLDDHVDADNLPKQPLSWYHEIRAGELNNQTSLFLVLPGTHCDVVHGLVYSGPFWTSDSVKLTGVGYLRQRCVLAPRDAGLTYMDSPYSVDRIRLLGPEVESATRERFNPTIFAFHDVCWNLLSSRVTVGGTSSAAIAECLYQVLSTLRADGKRHSDEAMDRHRALDPLRDYGGIWELADTTSDYYYDVSAGEDCPFIDADPTKCVTAGGGGKGPIGVTIRDESNDTILSSSHGDHDREATAATKHYDIFLKLPPEIVTAVLAELPSRDVCSLRLASRAVASVSSPRHLTSSFWQSRFKGENELAFYAALTPLRMASRGWLDLYRKVRDGLREPCNFPGLCNRR
jgi:hypothetical protein